MSLDDTIITSVIFERAAVCGTGVLDPSGRDERLAINHYGRKMLSFQKRGKIRPEDSDENIAASLSSGILVWLFWQIAPDLLLWIVQAIRKRIWQQE